MQPANRGRVASARVDVDAGGLVVVVTIPDAADVEGVLLPVGAEDGIAISALERVAASIVGMDVKVQDGKLMADPPEAGVFRGFTWAGS